MTSFLTQLMDIGRPYWKLVWSGGHLHGRIWKNFRKFVVQFKPVQYMETHLLTEITMKRLREVIWSMMKACGSSGANRVRIICPDLQVSSYYKMWTPFFNPLSIQKKLLDHIASNLVWRFYLIFYFNSPKRLLIFHSSSNFSHFPKSTTFIQLPHKLGLRWNIKNRLGELE